VRNLLIVGAGDIARRAIPLLTGRWRVHALVRDAGRAPALAALGAVPLAGDLDDPARIVLPPGGLEAVLHLAPPPEQGTADSRTRHLIGVLDRAAMVSQQEMRPPLRLVYASTTGVYGDCGGAEIDETRPPAPQTDRAWRRLDAENALREWAGRSGTILSILRVPGIYAADRLPLARLRAGTPVLRPEDDVYTNHIHAEDLAAITVRALESDRAGGVFHASDDSMLRMGDYFDLVADTFGLPRPPRIARAEAAARLPAMLLSFMGESRRLSNRLMKSRLGVILRYPTVRDGLADAVRAAGQKR